MSALTMRDEFEAWAVKEFGLTAGHLIKDPEENDEYGNYPTQCYWEVWQASRAALVIELPQGGYFAGYDNEHMMESRDVVDAIEEAGAKVKP